MPFRVECPHCETSYTLKRLGIAQPYDGMSLVIQCSVCQKRFDFLYNPIPATVKVRRKLLGIPLGFKQVPYTWQDD